ncbi:MAG: hypothetical protein C0501_18005 [Isosphaera sp.]|nr:hypothetical protein [Isosphaera sp.]
MPTKTFAAAAALVLTAGTADGQVIYGPAPGVYGSGYSVPGRVPTVGYGGGFNTPGYYGGNFANRGVIYAGSPVTPLVSAAPNFVTSAGYLPGAAVYNPYPVGSGVYSSYTSGFGLTNRGFGYNTYAPSFAYNNFGTGYPGTGYYPTYSGVYNSGLYSPGYVGGFNVITVPTVRGGTYTRVR